MCNVRNDTEMYIMQCTTNSGILECKRIEHKHNVVYESMI